MKEVNENLSTYIDRIERFEEQFADQDIVISPSLKNEVLIDGDEEDISKEPVLWRLYEHNMFYVVTVPPGKSIKEHKHEESIFRFIAQGSLVLNGEHEISAGMWFVVKADTPYRIETKEGYVSLAAYVSNCQTSRALGVGTYLVKDKS